MSKVSSGIRRTPSTTCDHNGSRTIMGEQMASLPHSAVQLSRSWATIACELRSQPDALRVCLARAIARIIRELGLDEGPDE